MKLQVWATKCYKNLDELTLGGGKEESSGKKRWSQISRWAFSVKNVNNQAFPGPSPESGGRHDMSFPSRKPYLWGSSERTRGLTECQVTFRFLISFSFCGYESVRVEGTVSWLNWALVKLGYSPGIRAVWKSLWINTEDILGGSWTEEPISMKPSLSDMNWRFKVETILRGCFWPAA